LWLRERQADILNGAVWLSTSDYIAYKLTGQKATDYTLAARTYGFRIDTKVWDGEVLENLGIEGSLFPPVKPSGPLWDTSGKR